MAEPSDRPVVDPSTGTPLPSELPPQALRVTMGADTRIIHGQLKVARAGKFEFYCDEPAYLGGEDRYPQPLTYVAAGIGF